jgi:hypothetical protein
MHHTISILTNSHTPANQLADALLDGRLINIHIQSLTDGAEDYDHLDPIEWEDMTRAVVITELVSQIDSLKQDTGQQWVFSF